MKINLPKTFQNKKKLTKTKRNLPKQKEAHQNYENKKKLTPHKNNNEIYRRQKNKSLNLCTATRCSSFISSCTLFHLAGAKK